MSDPQPEPLDADDVRTPDGVLRLIVLHRSDDVERDVAPLRQLSVVALDLAWQGTVWTLPAGASALLWELAPEDGADRRVAALARSVPSLSYSAAPSPELVELSRSLGFRQHLIAPIQLVDLERGLGIPSLVDLADRLEGVAPRFGRLAARPEVLGDLVRAVNASIDPDAVAAALVARIGEWLPLTAWAIIAVEPDGLTRWLGGRDLDKDFKAPADAVAELVVRTGQPAIRTTHLVDGPGSLQGSQPVRGDVTVFGWPLLAGGSVVGVLVGFDQGRVRRMPTIPRELADALTRLVEPAAYALGHALRVARAEALSVTDDLTQLFNSRFLHDALRKEAKRALRSGSHLSLLFVDLDGFKAINDVYGHLLGSRALIEAADVVRKSARETDIVARFGGDEFAVVLPETPVEGARSLARRLRDRIARHLFLADRGQGNRLTASIGVATMPDVADTVEGLINAADAAMYRVKLHGKNGIHVATRGTDSVPVGRDDEPDDDEE